MIGHVINLHNKTCKVCRVPLKKIIDTDTCFPCLLKEVNMDTLSMVGEFHKTFGHPILDTPNLIKGGLRVDLIQEELDELKEALATNDHVEAFDALCDLQYVLDGAFLALGFHKAKMAGMREVHRSNMSKLGEDGKPIYRDDGKILKGPNFSEPDLKKVLDETYS